MIPNLDLDYLRGLTDRLSIAVSRSNKVETYSAKRRQGYHDFAQDQIKYIQLCFDTLLAED
ncbi:MAG: hypothetical protein AAF518_16270 [Spirochaetota bacterium]